MVLKRVHVLGTVDKEAGALLRLARKRPVPKPAMKRKVAPHSRTIFLMCRLSGPFSAAPSGRTRNGGTCERQSLGVGCHKRT